MALIELVDISKSFDGELVLDEFNLKIKENEFITLLGPSGCGKTTTLRILGGFETPDTGKVLFQGEDITNLAPNKRPLNTVFQKYALFPHMNIAENIAFGLKISGKSKEYINDKIKYALKLVNLSGFEKRSVDSLSGGQQQRVAIARALALKPELLLLDEPTSALAPELVGEVLETIKNVAAEGHTMLLVSHEMNFVRHVANKVIFLDGGHVVEYGTPKEVFTNPQNERTKEFLRKMQLLNEPEYVI